MVGNRTRVKVVKNKVAPPFRQAEFDIIYNEGISKEGDLIDLGVEDGFVEKSGSWYSYGEERIGQGRENARRFLKENPDVSPAAGRAGLRGPWAQAADAVRPPTPRPSRRARRSRPSSAPSHLGSGPARLAAPGA